MIKSRLFLRLFSTIMATVGLFASAIYLFSVPLIEEKVYEIELNASRTILDNVFVMAGKINGSLEDQRALIRVAREKGVAARLDDMDEAVARRKAEAIAELRQALRNIRIARTGYVYIFDAADTMVIHPNANIEGTAFGALTDPATGRRISEELKAVADTDYPLRYLWDKPSDPGHYAYEKISWVRHFPGIWTA